MKKNLSFRVFENCTYSKAWCQSTAWGERLRPIICKLGSTHSELLSWSLWVSRKVSELPGTEAESIEEFALISSWLDHTKLLPLLSSAMDDETEGDDPPWNLLLAESHQFPPQIPVWNSSAMASKNSCCFVLAIFPSLFRFFNLASSPL